MNITDIKIFPMNEEKLKAFVSIVLDDEFIINDIKIIQGSQRMFISMPSKKRRDGNFKDIAHPIKKETREEMENIIINAYKEQSAAAV
jgi:stage V sporulation protein G